MFAFAGCNQKPAPTADQPSQPVVTQEPKTTEPVVTPTQSGKDKSTLGVIMYYDEARVLMADGTFKKSAADMTMSNGTKVLKDGKIVFPVGKMMKKHEETDRRVQLSNYTFVMSDGTIMWPDAVTTPDGTITFSSGVTWLPDGTLLDPSEGIIIFADGTKVEVFTGKMMTAADKKVELEVSLEE